MTEEKLYALQKIFDSEDRKIFVIAMHALMENVRMTPSERRLAEDIRAGCISAIESNPKFVPSATSERF